MSAKTPKVKPKPPPSVDALSKRAELAENEFWAALRTLEGDPRVEAVSVEVNRWFARIDRNQHLRYMFAAEACFLWLEKMLGRSFERPYNLQANVNYLLQNT